RDSVPQMIPHERCLNGDITMDDSPYRSCRRIIARCATREHGAERCGHRLQLGTPFLVPYAMPNCDDYRPIPLMPPAGGPALLRATDLNCDHTGAPLRAPAEAPRASRPRI